jgi:hypothetical protein
MCYTLKDKQAQGASGSKSPPSTPAGGAGKDSKEEANATIIDSEGRKTTDAYDEELHRTDTPAYILALAPYIDNFNWTLNPFLYLLSYVGACVCVCAFWVGLGVWGSVGVLGWALDVPGRVEWLGPLGGGGSIDRLTEQTIA